MGEKVRASDPIVGDGRWFDELDTPDSERTNLWNEMDPPPNHAPAVEVQSSPIPPHRVCRSQVNVATPGQWAPGSPGAKSGRGASYAISVLTQGMILDASTLASVRTRNGSGSSSAT